MLLPAYATDLWSATATATLTSGGLWQWHVAFFPPFQCCFTSIEAIRLARDGEPRTATSTFTQILSYLCVWPSSFCYLLCYLCVWPSSFCYLCVWPSSFCYLCVWPSSFCYLCVWPSSFCYLCVLPSSFCYLCVLPSSFCVMSSDAKEPIRDHVAYVCASH